MTALAPSPKDSKGPLERLGFNLESDYGPLPPTKWSQPWSATSVRFWTAVGALAVGFLLTSGVVVGRHAANEQSARKDELVELVRARQDRVDALSAELDGLRAQMGQMQTGTGAAGAPALGEAVDRAAMLSGLTAVQGPGARVTFSDAQGTCPSARPEDCRIQDTDVQLALNELWALGSEAIAVNGERVISTTAVRNAGSVILVNYRVLTSPYVIEAIGDPQALREGFLMTQLARDFEAWQKTFELGFKIEEVGDITIPAYGGALRIDQARAASVEDQR